MRGLTRDGTAEPVSRDQILRRERGQGNIDFPCCTDDHVQESREIKFSGANADREILIFPVVQMTTCRIGKLTKLVHTLAMELGRNPVSKHQIQSEYGDKQADAGRDG